MGLLHWLNRKLHIVADAPAYAEPPVLPPAPSRPAPCEEPCDDCTCCDGLEGLASIAGFTGIVISGPGYADSDPVWFYFYQGGDYRRTDRFTYETLMDAAVNVTLLKLEKAR